MSLSSTLEKSIESQCIESFSYHSDWSEELIHLQKRPVYCQEILSTLQESGWVFVATWNLKIKLIVQNR